MKPTTILLVLLLTGACSSAPIPETVQPAEIGGIAQLHRAGELYLAGQPTKEAFAELATRGVRLVIDLREPGELRDFDEPALVRELGMEYVNPAFRSPEELTDGVFDEVRRLLRDHADDAVLLHCGSANRVGAVWVTARILDDGVPFETAFDEARRVGLRSEGYEARAREYVLGPEAARWTELEDRIRSEFPDVAQISVDDLAARLASDDAPPLLVDVRGTEEYAVSHLQGARRAESLAEALAVLAGEPRDREIVLYCSVGYRSSRLASELAGEGFTNLANLEGSIFAWANAGNAVYREGEEVHAVHPYDEDWGRLLHRDLWSGLDGAR